MWPRCVYSLFFFFLFFFLWVDPAAEHDVIRTSKREIHTWTAGRITSWFQAHRLVFILIRPLYLFTGWTLAVNSPAPKGHAPPAALSMFYKYLGFFSLFFFFTSQPLRFNITSASVPHVLPLTWPISILQSVTTLKIEFLTVLEPVLQLPQMSPLCWWVCAFISTLVVLPPFILRTYAMD